MNRDLVNNIHESAWHWCWPCPGPTPVNQSLDAEIFDGDKVPLAETVVREAIQNSLDARLERSEAVRVHIDFHEEVNGPQISFLRQSMAYREEAGLPLPEGWAEGKVRWMNIEDFDSSGLRGNITSRTGDFWNYWLNFGLSNKAVKSRGGRGIGRVTFLIASTVSTVIGFTRRDEDGAEHACGMSVLKAGEYQGDFRSTHAYLAEREDKSVYRLHASAEFRNSLKTAFRFRQTATDGNDSGLSLAIPYPHEKLHEKGILASVIEHFGPAVLNGSLKVSIGTQELNQDTLPTLAMQAGPEFSESALKEDPNRYIELLHASKDSKNTATVLTLGKANKAEIASFSEHPDVKRMQGELENAKPVSFDLEFPLKGLQGKSISRIHCVVRQTPPGAKSIDMFFRDGMYLPMVRTRSPRGLDLLLAVNDAALSDYLNLCEGKAHLDLLENAEVKQKLKSRGCSVTEKRLVKNLPDALRLLFVPEVNEPDATVFADLFSVPSTEKTPRKRNPGRPKNKNPVVDPPNIKPRISAFLVVEIPGGFQLKGNPEFKDWPASLEMKIAYADGTRKPKWQTFDFELSKMPIEATDCTDWSTQDNRIRVIDCRENFNMEVTGFDTNRELDTRLRRIKSVTEEDNA